MKIWIGTAMVAAALTFGSAAASDPVIAAEACVAAEATATTTQRRARPAHRHVRTVTRVYEQPHYLGRPTYYVPAPFPLGFDFGFGWW